MQTGSRTLIGVFSDLSDAKHATDELRSLGISQVRLVENDQDATFTGTAERQGASSTDSYSSDSGHKKTGIGAFFSRLFGFDDNNDRSTWSLNQDSEAYFQNAYDRKHHLVIVEDAGDITVCREVISRFGGQIEEQGSQYYETERFRDRDLSSSSLGMNTGSSLSGSSLDMNQSIPSSGMSMNQTSGSSLDMNQSIPSSGMSMNQTSGSSLSQDQSWSANDRMDLDRDSSLTSSRGDFSADSTLSGNRTDFDRSQTLSGARLDSDMDTNLDSERVMQLREEQLDVHTERMQTGEVSLRKEIITETRTIEVPVTREEIVVERRAVDGIPVEGSLETAGLDMDSREIRVPVSEEFVHIDKKVVPREEIRVSKESITDVKTVSEEVRREEAQVDSDGKVSIKDRRDGSRTPLTSTRGSDSVQPGV